MEDVNNAAPSAAATETPQQFEAETDLSNLSDEDLHSWRMTGFIPEKKKDQPKEASAPSAAPAKKTPSENASPSESDESRQENEGSDLSEDEFKRLSAKAQKRIRGLVARNKELEAKSAEPTPAARTEPAKQPPNQPAAEFKETRPKPTPQDTKADGSAKYSSYEEYLDDRDTWNREQWSAKEKFDREQTERKTAEAKAAQDREQWTKQRTERLETATKKNPDLAAIVKDEKFFTKVPGPMREDLAYWFYDRPSGWDVAAYLHSHPAELEAIAKFGNRTDVFAALRDIEVSLEKPSAPPARQVSQAKPPVREIAGRGTPPEDEQEAAEAAGDVTRWMELENRRELAKRQGR